MKGCEGVQAIEQRGAMMSLSRGRVTWFRDSNNQIIELTTHSNRYRLR